MKEIIVHPFPELHTTTHDIPIPIPGSNEIVIKVHAAGSNPKGTLLLPYPPQSRKYIPSIPNHQIFTSP